jgi:hypothetical protein
VTFNEELDKIFTEKDLEKDPLRKLEEFKAPSILDPKNILNDDEERTLDGIMSRIGIEVKHKRLLIKPFF